MLRTKLPNQKALFFILGLCVAILIINSCKKTGDLKAIDPTGNETPKERTPENFFNLPANASPVMIRIAKELERQNKTNEFIKEFIAREGFPIWNKVRTALYKRKYNTQSLDGDGGGGTTDTIVYIPLVVSAQQYVHGFLKATITDTIDIKLFRQNDYVNFPFKTSITTSSLTTAEEFAMRMMSMDHDVFGSTEFKLVDKRMFHNNTNYSDTANIQLFVKIDSVNGESSFVGGSATNNFIYDECYIVTKYTNICNNFSGSGPSNMLATCWVESLDEFCVSSSSSGGSEGGSFPSGPGGNGSGEGGPTGGGGGGGGSGNPCVPNGNNVLNGFIPIECNPGGGGNPWPPEHSQNYLDLQWMNNIIDSTSNPCIGNAINNLKLINAKLPRIIRDFFGTNPSFDLKFKSYYTSSGSCSGATSCEPEGGKTDLIPHNNTFTISINDYYHNATDLSLITTIIHEALHAQLVTWLREAVINNDTVRQHQLASLYGSVFTPDFSYSATVYNTAIDVTVQHAAIATAYKSLVAEALRIYAQSKNINLTNAESEALAWSGLNTTTAFTNLSPTNQIYITGKINAEKDPYGNTINGTGGNPQEAATGHPCNSN